MELIQKTQSQEMRSLKVIRLEDIQEESIEFLVEPFFIKNGINLITAPQKSLKSMIILYLCLCCLNEENFLNIKANKVNKVLLIDAENNRGEIKSRVLKLGGSFENILLTNEYVFFDKDSSITTKLVNTIKENAIDLIVIDTLRRTNVYLDENSSKDVNLFFSKIQPLKELATIIVIHHETKPTALSQRTYYRGSGDIVGAVDSHISIKKRTGRKGSVELILSHENARYSHESEPLLIEFKYDESHFEFKYSGKSDEILPLKSLKEDRIRLKALIEFIQSSREKGRGTSELNDFCKQNFNIGEHKSKELRDRLDKIKIIKSNLDKGKILFTYVDYAAQHLKSIGIRAAEQQDEIV